MRQSNLLRKIRPEAVQYLEQGLEFERVEYDLRTEIVVQARNVRRWVWQVEDLKKDVL